MTVAPLTAGELVDARRFQLAALPTAGSVATRSVSRSATGEVLHPTATSRPWARPGWAATELAAFDAALEVLGAKLAEAGAEPIDPGTLLPLRIARPTLAELAPYGDAAVDVRPQWVITAPAELAVEVGEVVRVLPPADRFTAQALELLPAGVLAAMVADPLVLRVVGLLTISASWATATRLAAIEVPG